MSTHTQVKKLWKGLFHQLNWFRIHLLSYTLIPILFSGFFMASNPSQSSGQFVTSYIDALFMCFSAMTVCGLSTVSVSALQPAQQGFLFVLMIIGDISVVNIITIVCRQTWFLTSCPNVVNIKLHQSIKQTSEYSAAENGERNKPGFTSSMDQKNRQGKEEQMRGTEQKKQNGRHSEGCLVDGDVRSDSIDPTKSAQSNYNPYEAGFRRRHQKRIDNGGSSNKPDNPRDPHGHVPHASSGRKVHSGRGGFPSPLPIAWSILSRIFPKTFSRLSELLRQYDVESIHSPHALSKIKSAVRDTLSEHKDEKEERESERVKWLPLELRSVVVGRNSQFFEEEMHDDDLQLLGALEYRATRLLSILLVVHVLFWIFCPVLIIAIYFAKVHYWDSNFVANGGTQSGTVSTTWFTFFQSASAYSSCGLSLVDLVMVPFGNCYLLIYVLLLPMLAGNQALPLFLRCEIWLLSKVVRNGGETEVSLHFILTHSRRFFLYLFPAYQSWWLASIEILLCIFGTVFFVLFNRGLDYYASLGTGWDKFTLGLFESWASRASGLGIVSLGSLAPATNFLYLMLIFTSNYPLVMAIRSTNVYEERALGLHGEHAPNQHNEQGQQRGQIFSKYLKHHLLPQIYFDLWPIALGTLFICVAERALLTDGNNDGWIDVFRILFEATSGYGTVGLSYGNPFNTSSLSATFGIVGKLIIILLMLRGRHRGLPLAIDRAIMFPVEYLRFSDNKREKVEEDRVNQAREAADQE